MKTLKMLLEFIFYISFFLINTTFLIAQNKYDSTLEEDILAISLQIEQTKDESSQYTNVQVRDLISIRSQILNNTKAMLEQKKHSIEHKISIIYTYKGEIYKPTKEQTIINNIESEINEQKIKLSEAEAEFSKYSDSLVKGMLIFEQVATIKNTIAMLEQKKLSLIYGIPLFIIQNDQNEKEKKTKSSLSQDKQKQKDENKRKEKEEYEEQERIKKMHNEELEQERIKKAQEQEREQEEKERENKQKQEKALELLKESLIEIKEKLKEEKEKRQAKIEIIDWHSRADSRYYIYVEGILKNISDNVAKRVQVKIKSLDGYGKLVSLDDGYADPYNMAPGQEATFKIMIKFISGIEKFSLSVLWENN